LLNLLGNRIHVLLQPNSLIIDHPTATQARKTKDGQPDCKRSIAIHSFLSKTGSIQASQ
jgi:hypothetical protein